MAIFLTMKTNARNYLEELRMTQHDAFSGLMRDASASSPSEEWLARALELLREGRKVMSLRPEPTVSEATRGMPAVMQALIEEGHPMSPSELARKAGVSDARIANTLRALEKRGYVERRGCEHDRRRVEVLVTEKGYEVASKHFEECLDLIARFLEELGPEDTESLVRVVGRIGEVMEARRAEGRQVHI